MLRQCVRVREGGDKEFRILKGIFTLMSVEIRISCIEESSQSHTQEYENKGFVRFEGCSPRLDECGNKALVYFKGCILVIMALTTLRWLHSSK